MEILKELIIIGIFPAVMIISAVTDMLMMRIPNWLTYTFAIAFLPFALFLEMTWMDIGWHALTAFCVLIVTFIMFSFRWIGGGDAKLISATTLWLGPSLLFNYFVLFSLFGGLLTMFIVFIRKVGLPRSLMRHNWINRIMTTTGSIPYGVALAIGGFIAYQNTGWLQLL